MRGKKLAVYTCIIVVATAVATYSLTWITNAFIFGFEPSRTGVFNGSDNTTEITSELQQIKNLIDLHYYKEYDEDAMTVGALKGAVYSLGDPYSGYYTNEEYLSFNEQITGHYSGIGVTVTMDTTDNTILVISTQKGTPAHKAGLTTDDKIIAINGEAIPSDLEAAVSKIKGKDGTKVNLTILKKDTGKTVDMDIERQDITLDTLTSEIIQGDIGYIELTSFDESTIKEFKKEIETLEEKGAKSIILDLRGNPGGMVDAAAVVGDVLLPECDITYIEGKSGKREYIRSDKECYEGELVVLVDGGSASASEIIAGAIRDNKRGKIVGTQTYGKGLVQMMYPLSMGGGYVKLTIARYFTPNGEDINKKGITPDYLVEPSGNNSEDLQLNKAIELLKK